MHNPHQIKLMQAAPRLGIEVEDLAEEMGMDVVAYKKDGRTIFTIEGQSYPGLSEQACLMVDNKMACKSLLKRLDIPTAPGLRIDDPGEQRKEIEDFVAKYAPVVCKPQLGQDGIGVKMGITTTEEVLAHMDELARPAMIEKEISGGDLRLQSLHGTLLAACVRKPTTLVGDGVATVQELIDARNVVIAAQNPLNHIDINRETTELLEAADLTLDSVMERGDEVTIKRITNMAQGARAIDVTDEVHPDYRICIEKIAKTLGMSIFAMDFLCDDHRIPMANNEAYCLEVNARPAWMHHTFSERKTHDMPTLILKELLNLD